MATPRGSIKLGMHLSVGDGAPVLIADIDVPMTIALVAQETHPGSLSTNLNVTVDHDAFRASLAEQLHALADTVAVKPAPERSGGFADVIAGNREALREQMGMEPAGGPIGPRAFIPR